MSGEINWGEPIEAVRSEQDIQPAVLVEGDSFNQRMVMIEGMRLVVNTDGRVPATYWRIRNVAQATSQPRTAPSGGEVGPEVGGVHDLREARRQDADLYDRMEALVRKLATWTWVAHTDANKDYAEARAIVALLPEPVDADLVEARRIACESSRWEPGDQAWRDVEQGRSDHIPMVRAALAGLKAGRALEKEAGR